MKIIPIFSLTILSQVSAESSFDTNTGSIVNSDGLIYNEAGDCLQIIAKAKNNPTAQAKKCQKGNLHFSNACADALANNNPIPNSAKWSQQDDNGNGNFKISSNSDECNGFQLEILEITRENGKIKKKLVLGNNGGDSFTFNKNSQGFWRSAENENNIVGELENSGGKLALISNNKMVDFDFSSNACDFETCEPESINLLDAAQWQHEEGYWIGEYSLFGADGNPSTSNSWNYKYDHYKGFITGNVVNHKYRQRNVFLYPPQDSDICDSGTDSVTGTGTCGVNGNGKVFEADQQAITCSMNPELFGDIEGPYGSMTYTYTQLVGQDNAVLYQVFLTKGALNYYEAIILGNPYGRCNLQTMDCGYDSDRLMQSQLTTITVGADGTVRRVRTAQGFDAFANIGAPSYASFYRETKVTEQEFWTAFNQTVSDYNIQESDLCAWKSSDTGGTVASGLTGGFGACQGHLDESFELV